MNCKNLHVGDKVYVVSLTARALSSDGKVVKVGRKYLTVSFGGWRSDKFRIDNGDQKSDYSPMFRLYFSKAAYEEQKQARELAEKLAHFLSCHKFNLSLTSLITAADAVGMPRDDNN